MVRLEKEAYSSTTDAHSFKLPPNFEPYSYALGFAIGLRLRELQHTNSIKFFTFREILNKHLKMNL